MVNIMERTNMITLVILKNHIWSKNYEGNGYGLDLNLPIIL